MPPVITETEIDIPATPVDVFAQLMNAAQFERWQPVHHDWPEGSPEIVEGASFTQRTRYGGRTADVRWTVVEMRAPVAVMFEGTGPMGMRLRSAYALSDQANGAGTTLRAYSEVEGGPVAGPMRRVAQRRAQGVADEALANLRAIVDDRHEPVRERSAPPRRRGLPGVIGAVLSTLGSAIAPVRSTALAPVRSTARIAAPMITAAPVPRPARRLLRRLLGR